MVEKAIAPDKARFVSSIEMLRRMRYAAIREEARNYAGIETPTREQEVLRDSETLAVVTARLMLAYTDGTSPSEPRDAWETIYSTLQAFYEDPHEYSYSGAPAESNFKEWMFDAWIMAQHAGVKSRLTVRYYALNHIPFRSLGDISATIGIFAPLSTDFLMSTYHKIFIRTYVTPECFDVKPMALHIPTRTGILPLNEAGLPIYHDKQAIGIFVDKVDTTLTARLADASVRRAYPGMTVYSAVDNRRKW